MGIYAKDVQKLYIAYFNRPADVLGLAYWEEQVAKNGGSTAAIANAFSASAEYKAIYNGKSTADIINTIYTNIFGRTAEPAAITYWGTRLDNGTFNIGNITTSVMVGAQNDDKTTIDNKTTAADLFTTHLDTSAEIIAYSGDAANAVAKAWLAGVTSVASTLTAATASVDTSISSISSATVANGTTFTLTTAADAITGTAGNDTINGVSATGASAATDSFGVSDVINGGAGTDTLSVTNTGATADATAGAQISGVEIFNIRNTAATGTASTLDASKVAGLTAVNSNLGTGDLAVSNLASGASVGIIGNSSVQNGKLTASYVKTVTAGTGTLNLAGGTDGTNSDVVLNNAAAGDAGAGNITSVVINSTGAANTIKSLDLKGANVGAGTAAAAVTAMTINASSNLTTGNITNFAGTSAAITVTGAATSVNLGTIEASTVKTIDASAMSAGGITATLNTSVTSVKGGAGKDVITTAATTAAGAVIDGGAGTADVLDLAAVNDVSTTAKAAQYTNFETLRQSKAGTVDMSLFTGMTSVELNNATAGATNLSATQAAAITNRLNITSSTISLKDATGTSDAVTVTLENATATTGVATSADLAGLTMNGVETLNIVSKTGATADKSVVSFTAVDKLAAINVSGTNHVALNLANTAVAVTVASTQTGTAVLDVSGLAIKGSSITTTGNADAISATAAIAGTTGDFVTYNAGAGNDTITTTVAAINNTSAGNASLKIDGGAGTDTVSTDAGTYADANFQFLTNVEKLTFTGGGALSVTTGGFFDTNFKTAGVTFTDTAWAGATSQAIDASSFTGKVTATMTQSDTDAGSSFSLKSGSGDDVIAVTTGGALTATTNTIATGAGADTVTLTAAALNATGKISVNLGQGNDTLTVAYAGAGLLDLIGGTGADTVDFGTGHTASKFNANIGIGDSGTFVKPSSNTISTVNFDVYTNVKDTDTVTLTGNTASVVTTINTGSDLSTATFADQTVTAVRGTYDSSAKTFVGLASGADLLVVADTTAGAGVTYEAVVLVGQTALASVSAGGLITA